MSDLHDWFNDLTPDEQQRLHDSARNSPLDLDRYPMALEVARELQAWQHLAIEVMEAHNEWLSRTKARFEHFGIPWTTSHFQRESWLSEYEG